MASTGVSAPPRYSEARALPFWPSVIVVALALVASGVLYTFEPTQVRFYPFCVFHATTGLLCPGCGSLRALHQILHGNIMTAFRFNALLVSSLPLMAGLFGQFVVTKFRHQPWRFSPKPIYLWVGLVILVVFGIVRNLHLSGLAFMTP